MTIIKNASGYYALIPVITQYRHIANLDWEVPGIEVMGNFETKEEHDAWQADCLAKFEDHNAVELRGLALMAFKEAITDVYREA